MKINHNMSAITANNQLLNTENNLSGIMERLSSGLKLNHAKDNPAGMAISHKMKTQIEGLDRANNNASDGKAVIEIADGALNEVTEMLQRMRELCVQAANDTNCDDDKQAIQNEIAELKEEIDRVSTDTEYNTMKLLDGSQNSRVYSNSVSRLSVSRYVDEGDYKLTIKTAAKQAEVDGGSVGDYPGEGGKVSINGYIIDIEKGDTADTVYEKLRKGAEKGECLISDKGQPLKITSTAFGKDAVVSIGGDADVLTYLGLSDNTADPKYGEDAEIDLKDPGVKGFSDKATVKYEGNKITVSDTGGFEMSFYAAKTEYTKDPVTGKKSSKVTPYDGDVEIEVTDIGNMSLQIGANQHQTIAVEIPKVNCEMMYIDDLDVTTVTGADRGITAIDKAINYVDSARSRLGAYENRLEHTMNDLQASSENMTKALSTLSDADMAKEMVDYTTYNVLNQAGVSVLSQANDLPQTVLQLLQ